MEFMQVVFISEMLLKEEENKLKANYRAAAFTAYLQGAGNKKTFNEYLRAVGLSEDDRSKKKSSKEDELKKSMEVIEKIKRLRSKKLKK